MTVLCMPALLSTHPAPYKECARITEHDLLNPSREAQAPCVRPVPRTQVLATRAPAAPAPRQVVVLGVRLAPTTAHAPARATSSVGG